MTSSNDVGARCQNVLSFGGYKLGAQERLFTIMYKQQKYYQFR